LPPYIGITISNNCGTLPYFIRDNAKLIGIEVKRINTDEGKQIIQDALKKYNSYGVEWTKVYFDEKSGGFVVYHKKHNFAKTGGGGDAEKTVGKMLAKYNGKQVEFLPEGGKKKPDVKFDEQTWDIKTITNANEETIRTYIKDARKAENAIFYWKKESDKLEMLISAIGRSAGYFRSKNRLHEMPNIFYMDNGILKLLWNK